MLTVCLSAIDTQEEKDRFEQLYFEHRQDMYAVAYSILKNNHDAEDAVSQSFIKIAENYTKISSIPCNEIKAYFVIIVRNTAINYYNKNKYLAKHSAPLNEQAVADDSYFDEYDYDSLIDALGKLPQKYKDVLYIYYLQGFTAKETARQLGIKENTVCQRAARAKAMLKKILEEDDYFEK